MKAIFSQKSPPKLYFLNFYFSAKQKMSTKELEEIFFRNIFFRVSFFISEKISEY